MNLDYLETRPYRSRYLKDNNAKILVDACQKAYKEGFSGYWERFGYEIGGPVCYAYTNWIAKHVENNPKITGLAFVARDGWLLKQIFERLQSKKHIKTGYVYASRSLALLNCNKDNSNKYKEYIRSIDLGEGTVGVVDTVTMKFSSQRLIKESIDNNTFGFYWVVLNNRLRYEGNYDFVSYQPQGYHKIRVWNLMEFIMTSHESPIVSLNDGNPVFKTPDANEIKRQEVFEGIEKGVLRFVDDIVSTRDFPSFDNILITRWVNDFLRHPNSEDERFFSKIVISEKADHSDQTMLDPFGRYKKNFSYKNVKDRIWLISQRSTLLYEFLHSCNMVLRNIRTHLKGIKYVRFDSGNLNEMVDMVDKYDIISFDIFDTLIRRPYKKPTDLFFDLEKSNDMFDFRDNRIRAEADARRLAGGNGEIDIYAIYELLAEKYGADPQEFAQKEIEEEIKVCYPDERMLELYNILKKKGKKMIAVSDMYLPSSVLRKMLDKCGYMDIEQIFVSCEYGAGKPNGDLQRIVWQKVGMDKKIIHIGDNQYSDVSGSLEAGWMAVKVDIKKE